MNNKRIICLAVIGILVFGCLGYLAYTGAFSPEDEGWYDEDTRIGWNYRDEWYYVIDENNNVSKPESEFRRGYTHVGRVTHLSENVRSYLIKEGMRLPYR